MMANIITTCRIILSLILIKCPVFSHLFYWLYVTAGITDIIDGSVARFMNQETDFGAKYDTCADIIFTAVVLIKVLNAVYVPFWLIMWIICIAVIKFITIIRGIIKSGNFVSEHTVMNKICGVLLFVFPLCIKRFSLRFASVFEILICTTATVAAIQEYLLQTGKKNDIDTKKTF